MSETAAAEVGTARMADGTSLRTRRWPAIREPWATVLLVHGISEHAGRYAHVATALAAEGLDVHAYDQRGCGASDGPRAYVERWDVLHDDLQARLAAARETAAGRPLVLYGHSLGGLIVAGYLLADPQRPLPDLAVLSAPALVANVPAWKRRLVLVLGGLLPRLSVENDLPRGGLSSDPTVESRYAADPLIHTRTTTRFGAEGLREQERIGRLLAQGVPMPVPTYVLHGSIDAVVPPAASELLVGRGDVSRRVWDGLRHESHNEPVWRDVLGEVVAWVRSRAHATDTRPPSVGMPAGAV